MTQEEKTKTFKMISNWRNPSVSMVPKNIAALQGLMATHLSHEACAQIMPCITETFHVSTDTM